jgi:geranylgeranyl pyrophosphate synthase
MAMIPDHHTMPDPEYAAALAAVGQIIDERIGQRPVVAGIAGRHFDRPRYVRAALALCAADISGGDPKQVWHVAATIELIGTAARVHGELLGGGRAGPHVPGRQWHGDAALMVGDYLLAVAAVEMARVPDPRIIAWLAEAVMAISEAALTPVVRALPADDAWQRYLEHAGSATATLIAAACRAGALAGGGAAPPLELLGAAGHALGIAAHMFHDAVQFGSPSANTSPTSLGLPWLLAATDDPALGAMMTVPLSAADLPALLARVDVAALAHRSHGCAVAHRDAALAQLAPLGARSASFARLARQLVPDLPARGAAGTA